MRHLLVGLLLALLAPAPALAANRVAAFYYPWYGTVSADGVHIEPYPERSVASITSDVAYLATTYGIRTFYVYRALDLPAADWAAARPALHAVRGTTVYAQTALAGAAAAGGFDGLYTYDIVTYGAQTFRRICGEAHAEHLLCAPSVGPGYDARR